MSTINFGDAKEFFPKSFNDRYNQYIKFSVDKALLDGLWLEFGVASGETTRKYVEFMPNNLKPLFGFDSFHGLPEDWALHRKGAFSSDGIVPQIEGAEMIVGMFDETLSSFISKQEKNISVLVIDCDLYSSTKTIFDNCKHKIIPGTVIIFDELHNGDGIYHDWEKHEYKAFMELIKEKNVEFNWLAYVPNGEQASCIITKIDN
jgi:hypothetical protein